MTNPIFNDPYAGICWVKRDTSILNAGKEIIFRQDGVEIPDFWSQLSADITASKYFYGKLGTKDREWSLRQLLERVVGRIVSWSLEETSDHKPYFSSKGEATYFGNKLTYYLVRQYCSFNSPVWFNLGVRDRPQQTGACFLLSVEDTLESILDWIKLEGMIFKGGSGAGTNLSALRSSKEFLSGGGRPSGPVSFMKGADAVSGVIKSAGTTRRAAALVCLDVGHPDILEFIRCKPHEEKKARDLISLGYDGSTLDSEAFQSISFQNANNSIRVSDRFMEAVRLNSPWELKAVTTGEVLQVLPARAIMKEICLAAHQCGDPGLQFDDTINSWNPTPNSGRIHTSNPCGEHNYLDWTVCNLSSLNLLKFLNPDNTFDIKTLLDVTDTMLTAQEILVGSSYYPSPRIEEMTKRFRPLGLGFGNLGAMLMCMGLPYDSIEGRKTASLLTSLIHGQCALTSSRISQKIGPFSGYQENEEPYLEIIRRHVGALDQIECPTNLKYSPTSLALKAESLEIWKEAISCGTLFGFRNGQLTNVAPQGTISFMMDFDTTGVEPDISLVKYKKMVGGGFTKMINRSIPRTLFTLGYSGDETARILAYIEEYGRVEGCSILREEHLPIFDCALLADGGTRSISVDAHIKMVAEIQPFLSSGISKTCNLPESATPEDFERAYFLAWELGVKCISAYRDGSKAIQPLSTTTKNEISISTHSIPIIPINTNGNGKHQKLDSYVFPISLLKSNGKIVESFDGTAPSCPTCGNLTQQSGTCHTCLSCGAQSSCGL